MASIQKSTPSKVFESIRSVTGATDEQIMQFCVCRNITPEELLNDAALCDELIGTVGAIAPTAPAKTAKRGRKPKSTNVPNSGIQSYQSRVNAEIQGMEHSIESHLSQWEQAKAEQLLERFEQTPSNVMRLINDGLEVYRDDADSFCSQLGNALNAAFPLP